jgi:hypothetical protein
MIEGRVRAIANTFPLPEDYMYSLEKSNPGDGVRYSLAIVRKDYQGGDFYDIPSLGSMRGPMFYELLRGMLEATFLRDAIARLEVRNVKTTSV